MNRRNLLRVCSHLPLWGLAAYLSTTPLLAQSLPPIQQRQEPFDSRDADSQRNPQLDRKLEVMKAAERQRRIGDDTQKILALTLRYRQAVNQSSTITDQEKSLVKQIEKLARDIRVRMETAQ